MFRSDSNQRKQSVCTDAGFRFPPATNQYLAGKGGLYFSTSIEDALKFSKDRNAYKHMFVCPMTNPNVEVYLNINNYRSYMELTTQQDTLFHGVKYGNELRAEFVKAGLQDCIFVPEWLALLENVNP
jgi:hypothetical protein